MTLVFANWIGYKEEVMVESVVILFWDKFHNTLTNMNHTIAVLNEISGGVARWNESCAAACVLGDVERTVAE